MASRYGSKASMATGFCGWSPSGWTLVKAVSSDIVAIIVTAVITTGRQRRRTAAGRPGR